MRIAVLALQPDFDRNLGQVDLRDGAALLGQGFFDPQHLRLAQVEIGVERIHLHDGREFGEPRCPHQRPDIHEMIGDRAVEGGGDGGIAEINLRELDARLCVLDRGGRLVDFRVLASCRTAWVLKSLLESVSLRW